MKVEALVKVKVKFIHFSFSSAFPQQELFRKFCREADQSPDQNGTYSVRTQWLTKASLSVLSENDTDKSCL